MPDLKKRQAHPKPFGSKQADDVQKKILFPKIIREKRKYIKKALSVAIHLTSVQQTV